MTPQGREALKQNLKDPWWRLCNLYKVTTKTGEVVTFKPNWAQQELYNTMWFLNIVLKARQLGCTTFIQLFMLDRCLFHANQSAGVIAHNLADAQAFFDDKIKFAYDNLPIEIRKTIPATSDSARELSFANGSSIRVGTSLRSGTYQYLHISEFGKLCAKFPEKANEVVTGSLNTVAPGQFVFIESTAEGPAGHFYDMCQRAIKLDASVSSGQAKRTKMDYQFHFFPWFHHPDYVLPDVEVAVPDELAEYFDRLQLEHGIELSAERINWYIKKAEEQGDSMRQEYPSKPDEAFERTFEGAIFGKSMLQVRRDKRLCELPIVRGVPVNTFWDLGRNDVTAIWFHQHVGAYEHFIDYFEDRLEDLTYYVGILQDKRDELDIVYGSHYLPHDVEVTDISSRNNESRKLILQRAGLNPIVVVPRIQDKRDSIESTRKRIVQCKFDETRCARGVEALEGYVREYDEDRATFKDRPKHTWHSNGADAFQQFGIGYRGDRSSMSAQIAQALRGGQRLQRIKSRHNPITNPDSSFIV